MPYSFDMERAHVRSSDRAPRLARPIRVTASERSAVFSREPRSSFWHIAREAAAVDKAAGTAAELRGPVTGARGARARAYLGGVQPSFPDFIIFGALQWARAVSPVVITEAAHPAYTWRAFTRALRRLCGARTHRQLNQCVGHDQRVIEASNAARIASSRLRFTPKSLYPNRDAERTCRHCASASSRNSKSSTKPNNRLLASARR